MEPLLYESLGYISNLPSVLKLIIVLLVGVIFAVLFGILIDKITKKKRLSKYISYIIIVGILIYGLFRFNPYTFNLLFYELSKNANLVINLLFVATIGIILTNVTIEIIDWVAGVLKVKEYFGEVGLGKEFLFIIETFIRVILYLVVLEVIILMLNLKSTLINTLVVSVIISVIALFTGLLFYGLKDVFVDWFNGLSLKSSNLFKPGRKIRFKDFSGEIVSVESTYTVLDDEKGEYVWIPNSKLYSSEIFVQKSRFDMKILDRFRKKFENFGLIGGYLAMILELFGLNYKQKKLAKFDERDSHKILSFVKEMTKSEVSGIVVPYKSVINLKQEVKNWLIEGGYILFEFFKPSIFPGIKKKKKNIVLCVGIENDSLILIDLSEGPYLMNYRDMEEALNNLDKKYYLVFARRGTNAFLRIKNRLYYSNPKYYEQLNKTAERKLKQIMRNSKDVDFVYPNVIR